MAKSHNLARSEGDGSGEPIHDMYDSEEYCDKDDRAPTRTTFYRKDVDSLDVSQRRKKKLRRILRRQEGENDGEVYYKERKDRNQQNASEWKRRLVSTFASQLSLTSRQKQRTNHLVNNVLNINSFGYYRTEQVVLGVVNVVAREDGRWIEEEEMFQQLMEDIEIVTDDGRPDMDTIKTLRRMVRERI